MLVSLERIPTFTTKEQWRKEKLFSFRTLLCIPKTRPFFRWRLVSFQGKQAPIPYIFLVLRIQTRNKRKNTNGLTRSMRTFYFCIPSMHRIGKSILFKINDFNTMWFFHLLLCTAQWVHIGYFFGTDLYFKKSNVCIGLCLGQHLKQPNPAKVWKD